jgi:M26 IgA1-specific Metallo-endopeptidase N-terminal region.
MVLYRDSGVILIVLSLTLVGMSVPLPGAGAGGGFVGTAQAQAGAGPTDVDTNDLSGDGSPSNPYEISNASELQAMEDDLTANYELVSDIDASNTAQFNSGDGFDPVGDGSGDFKGNFDGNGFRITGLTIDRGSSREEVGLFGEVDDATIESVSLDSVDITGNRSVGALAGLLEQDTTVRRVSVNGSVSGGINTGGLIGAVEDSTVKAGSVTGTVTGNSDVGGLAGQNVGGIILQSSSEATVTATGEQQSGGLVSAGAGGLVGGNFNDAVINLSYATGSVSGRKLADNW